MATVKNVWYEGFEADHPNKSVGEMITYKTLREMTNSADQNGWNFRWAKDESFVIVTWDGDVHREIFRRTTERVRT